MVLRAEKNRKVLKEVVLEVNKEAVWNGKEAVDIKEEVVVVE